MTSAIRPRHLGDGFFISRSCCLSLGRSSWLQFVGAWGLPGELFHERQRDELNDNINTITVNAMTETTNQLDALRLASDAEMFEAIDIVSSILDLPRSPTEEPDRLPLSDIVEIPSVFQVRGEQTDEHHAGALLDVLRRGADLKPVTVWRCGDGAVLIDGHHRLHAYRRLKGPEKSAITIPVAWFRGSLDEAIRAAAEANNEVKLPLNTEQRMNFGWRLVILDRYSKKEIATMAGISERSVANMRAVKKTLQGDGRGSDELPVNWYVALREAQHRDPERKELDYEDFEWQQAKVWADRMAKALSTKLAHSPTIAAKALVLHLGAKAADVAKEMLVEAGDPLGEKITEEMMADLPF